MLPGFHAGPDGLVLLLALLHYHSGAWTVALNGGNLFDYRQTRREKVVSPPLGNPVFSEAAKRAASKA